MKYIIFCFLFYLIFSCCDIGGKFKEMNKKLDHIELSIPAGSLISMIDSLNSLIKTLPDTTVEENHISINQNGFYVGRKSINSLHDSIYISIHKNRVFIDSLVGILRKEDIALAHFRKDYWKHAETFFKYKENVPESYRDYWWRQLYIDKDSTYTRNYLNIHNMYVVDSIGDLLLLKDTRFRELGKD